jgi:hypothetical protein
MNTTFDYSFLDYSFLRGLLPFLVLLAILQLALMAAALIHIWAKSPKETSTKVIWTVIVVLFNFFGPLAYLTFGRNMGGEADEKHDDLHKY